MATGLERLLIVEPTLSDTAGLFGSAAASSSVSLAQLQAQHPRVRYLTEVLPTPVIDIGLTDAGADWDTIWLGYVNAGDDDTFRASAAASREDLDSPAWQQASATTPVPGPQPQGSRNDREWVHWLLHLDTPRTDPWIRLSGNITAPRIPAGYAGADYMAAGRLIVGRAIRPPYNFSVGARTDPNAEPLTQYQRFDGTRYVRPTGRHRAFSCSSDWVGYETMMRDYDELARIVGRWKEVLLITDPQSSHLDKAIFYGKIQIGYAQKHKAILQQSGQPVDPDAEADILYSLNVQITQEVS